MKHLNPDMQLVFALANVPGDSVPMCVIGIPKLAYGFMQGGNTQDLDLTKCGIPLRLMLFGAETRKDITDLLKIASGPKTQDRMQEDFSIPLANEPAGGPVAARVLVEGKWQYFDAQDIAAAQLLAAKHAAPCSLLYDSNLPGG